MSVFVCVCVFAHIFAVFYLISVLGSSVQLCPTFCILVGSNKIYNNERTNVRANKRTYVRHAMPCTDTKHTHTDTCSYSKQTLQQQATTATIAADYCRLTCNKHNRTHSHTCIHSRFSSTKNISSQFFRRNLNNNNNSNSSKKHNNIMHNAHTVAVEQ